MNLKITYKGHTFRIKGDFQGKVVLSRSRWYSGYTFDFSKTEIGPCNSDGAELDADFLSEFILSDIYESKQADGCREWNGNDLFWEMEPESDFDKEHILWLEGKCPNHQG